MFVPGFSEQAEVPQEFLANGIGSGLEEKLENETTYQHTGIRGQSEQLLYLAG